MGLTKLALVFCLGVFLTSKSVESFEDWRDDAVNEIPDITNFIPDRIPSFVSAERSEPRREEISDETVGAIVSILNLEIIRQALKESPKDESDETTAETSDIPNIIMKMILQSEISETRSEEIVIETAGVPIAISERMFQDSKGLWGGRGPRKNGDAQTERATKAPKRRSIFATKLNSKPCHDEWQCQMHCKIAFSFNYNLSQCESTRCYCLSIPDNVPVGWDMTPKSLLYLWKGTK